MRSRIRYVWYGIKNLFLWFPVVWNDRSWDHWYFFTFLRFKLGLMEENFRKHGHYAGCEEDAKNMKACCDILDRLIADEYFEVAHKDHDLKWGDIKMSSTPTKDKNLERMLLTRPNVHSEEDKVKEREEFLVCCTIEEQLEIDDINKLFDTIKENIRKWWD